MFDLQTRLKLFHLQRMPHQTVLRRHENDVVATFRPELPPGVLVVALLVSLVWPDRNSYSKE